MKKKKIDEATGGYHYIDTGKTPTGLSALATGALVGLGIPTAISWLEKKGDTVDDTRNKQELKKIKKQIKGYKFSKAELEKKNKQGMKLKDILHKVWMADKVKK